MVKLLRKLFGHRTKKVKPVVPPFWPYKQSKLKRKSKIKGEWDIK
jgi:hypothetical protein